MNATSILPCFKFISPFPVNKNIQKSIQSDSQINSLYTDLQNLSTDFAKFEYNNDVKISKVKLRRTIAEELEKVAKKRISNINNTVLCQYYLWLDEIIRIHIKRRQVRIYKSSGKEYFDIDPIALQNIQNIINQYMSILEEEGIYDPAKFNDDLWLINMNIFVRGEPNFIIWPDDYQDEDDDWDDEEEDDF